MLRRVRRDAAHMVAPRDVGARSHELAGCLEASRGGADHAFGRPSRGSGVNGSDHTPLASWLAVEASRGGADYARPAFPRLWPCMCGGVRLTPRCAEEALLSIHVYDKGRRNLQGEHPLLT